MTEWEEIEGYVSTFFEFLKYIMTIIQETFGGLLGGDDTADAGADADADAKADA